MPTRFHQNSLTVDVQDCSFNMNSLSFHVQPDGTLTPDSRRTCANRIAMFPDKHIHIDIKEAKRTRSLDQNAYWFGMLNKYVVPKFREAGSNWSDWKLHCCLMHVLGYEEALVAPDGRIIASRMHSSEFDTKTWEEFMERARAYLATEYDIAVPLPHEGEL